MDEHIELPPGSSLDDWLGTARASIEQSMDGDGELSQLLLSVQIGTRVVTVHIGPATKEAFACLAGGIQRCFNHRLVLAEAMEEAKTATKQ